MFSIGVRRDAYARACAVIAGTVPPFQHSAAVPDSGDIVTHAHSLRCRPYGVTFPNSAQGLPMIAAFRTSLAWIFLGLMALTLTACHKKDRDPVPVFTQQPGSLTVSEGASASFTVSASPPSAKIQWYRNGVPISGATSATYTLAAVTAADTGSRFYAIATTTGGNVTSADAILTVRPAAPAITAQPASATVNQGATATFSVTATGSALTYQWQKNGTAIAGATTASYTTPATTGADNGATFAVVVTNTGGSVTSSAATLTIIVPPSITTQPANASVTPGQTATFTVVATGTAPTFQWQRGTTNIAGATSASYTTPATVAGDDGATFRVIVTNAAGSVTSNAATLTVTQPPVITTQPTNASVNVGATATFSAVATGTGVTYQWQRGTTNIAGATSAAYTTPATVIGDNGATFRVIVTNGGGSVTSNAATLTVTNPTPPSTFRATPAVGDYANGGVALKADGTVWAWGNGIKGENGDGLQSLASSPVQVMTGAGTPLTRIRKISVGQSHVLALDGDGQAWVWGTTTSLGSRQPSGGTTAAFAEPVLAAATGTTRISNVVDVAAGVNISAVALADGTVLTWGRNIEGQIGNGTTSATPVPFPTAVTGLTGVVEVAAGDNRVYARTADGRVFGWGDNSAGALGDGGLTNVSSPVQLSISTAIRIDAGSVSGMAIVADGTARVWGQHYYTGTAGLGTCTLVSSRTPATVAKVSGGASTYSSIAPLAGASALTFGGQLYQFGDLLDDGVSNQCTGAPTVSAGLSNLVGVARSWALFTHVWTADGTVYGIGQNGAGQLGVGNFTTTTTPRAIPGFNLLGASVAAGTNALSLDFESALPSSVNPGTAFLTGVQSFAGLGPTGNQFGGNMLRSATGNPVTITLTNLPAHTSINLAFLLAAIDSLDGAGTFPAGDYFKITLDGKVIFREAFANATADQIQTYISPPGVELARRVDLGFEGPGSFYTDSAYNMGADPQFQLIPHTASTLTITFTIESDVLQALNDESWGLDNVRISLNP